MQLHDILLLRTSASLHSVSVGAKPLSTGQCAPCRRLYQLGGLTPTTDTSLFLTTYRGGSHLPANIIYAVRMSRSFMDLCIGFFFKNHLKSCQILTHSCMIKGRIRFSRRLYYEETSCCRLWGHRAHWNNNCRNS